MKSDGEIMEILAAYDLTGSQRTAAVLVGCSHHTVAAHVAARDAGRAVGTPARRPRNVDPFLDWRELVPVVRVLRPVARYGARQSWTLA